MGEPDLDLVVLGGGGHVGLPLSLAFADSGWRVGIYDINTATLDRIASGEMPFLENGADELLPKMLASGRLFFDSTPAMLERTDRVVVVVGTPVDEFHGPSMTIFEQTVDAIAPHLRTGALVVLRSTVYPGTTEYVERRLRERGAKVDVAFCPERIAEGHALEELRTLPQIVGVESDVAAERAGELFGQLGAKTIRTTSKEAELAKLFTNTWRYMKFAVANQFLMIADQAGVDYTKVLAAVKDDYPRARDLPGPGFAAGPCLFKDTMQLSAFTSDHFPMGQAAMQVNEGLPAYLVSALQRRYGTLQGKTIGILGMAFKAESDDTRASLSFKLRKLLTWAGATVLCTDPYVEDARFIGLDETVQRSDIVVLGVPHQAYRGLELGGRDVVDVWGALGEGIRL
jgi:UDP-N-acetyl-D-mannosaminuronic acid dehydrogenase